VVRWKHGRRRRVAVTVRRGATLIEVIVAAAITAMIALAIGIPTYGAYARSRDARDAADALAQDIALLERSAQNGVAGEGATLEIDSTSPFSYSCYHGRPADLDPRTKLGGLVVQRAFPDVSLLGGPISASTPLLFASNGSAQYYDGSQWVDQHSPPIEFALSPASDPAHPVAVTLNMFTGEVTAP
jgi:type II secretory pathway pseudopilin PulG